MTKICAHAGCEETVGGSKENIITALNVGVEIIEFDLQPFNGQLYLSHEKVTDPSSLLLFQDGINLIKDSNVIINCDIKDVSICEEAIHIIEENDLVERVIFTGYVNTALLDSHAIKYYLNLDDNKYLLDEPDYNNLYNFYNQFTGNSTFLGFNLPYEKLQKDHIDYFNSKGMKVCLWTIDDKDYIDTYMGCVDCITTNKICYAVNCR